MKPIISLSLNLLKYSQTMSYNPYSLEGKTIFVTGASSGIGQSTAIECSKLGAKLIITGRNVERLQQTFNQLEGDGHMKIVGDLTIEKEINAIVDSLPKLDGFVNNAGIGKTLPVKFTNSDVLKNVLDINLVAPFLLAKQLLKNKKIKKGSSIVFTSSIASHHYAIGNSIYGCSKAAIENIAKHIAREYAHLGVRCNTIHPGMVDTPLVRRGTITEEQFQENIQSYPLKRWGKPEEIAWAIIYLLSDASSWVTGHSLVIDGGLTMR